MTEELSEWIEDLVVKSTTDAPICITLHQLTTMMIATYTKGYEDGKCLKSIS